MATGKWDLRSDTLTGTATRYGALATRNFTLSGSAGTGSASMDSGTITLHLPGEHLAISVPYRVTYAPDGFRRTAGTLYPITGTFSALDATTESAGWARPARSKA